MKNKEYEIENAIIRKVSFDTERGLSMHVYLEYKDSGQAFGGWLLYAPSGWAAHNCTANLAGHFIWRCLQIADTDDLSKMVGKTVRAEHSWDHIRAIGHITKDDWFVPSEEFAKLPGWKEEAK